MWANMSSLNVGGCRSLKRLPEQLGDIKGLKELDASYTAIEQLPVSISQLRALVQLKLYSCKKLRKLPEQFGSLEGLERFYAGDSALEELPDSFVCLTHLVKLDLAGCENLENLPDRIWRLKSLKVLGLQCCSKLKRLPDQLRKLQCLEDLDACSTAIEELPVSIGLLSRLKVLRLSSCKRLTYLPNSIGNLTSLTDLYLCNMDGIDLPDTVKDMKLKRLGLGEIRRCLPIILTLSFLKILSLRNDNPNFSSNKQVSLSKLLSVEHMKCKTNRSPLPEFPKYLKLLFLYDNATLGQLPDLSSYELLHSLYIWRCKSLKSFSKLPPNLRHLTVSCCSSLQNLPELSLLKELITLSVTGCSNLKSVDLKQSSFQVKPDDKISSFRANIPNRDIAEWFSYKSNGCTVSFDFPQNFEDNFVVALWVVYKTKYTNRRNCYLRAVIRNKTESISKNYDISTFTEIAGVVQSTVTCIGVGDILVKSGDDIDVSFQSSLYSHLGEFVGEVEVEKCGARVIQKMSSTPY